MNENYFPEKIAGIRSVLRALLPIAVMAGLLLCLGMVNFIADKTPQADQTRRAQELSIIYMQAERDRAEFTRLRKKHGLAATTVVIYEPGEIPYYYGAGAEKIALK
jgi:hypothetical protein